MTATTTDVSLSGADIALVAASLATLVSAESTVLSLASGGSGLEIAISANVTFVGSSIKAGFGDATTVAATGNVTISATSSVDVLSVADTASFADSSSFAVGAALTFDDVQSSAMAGIGLGDDPSVDVAGNVGISASSDVRIRAFSAVNGSTATDDATIAPGGQLVIVIVSSNADASIEESDVTAGGDLTIGATSRIRQNAAATGSSSHHDGSKDAAVALAFITGTAKAHVSGDSELTVGGALRLTAGNTNDLTTGGDAGPATIGAGIALLLLTVETTAYLDTTHAGNDQPDEPHDLRRHR